MNEAVNNFFRRAENKGRTEGRKEQALESAARMLADGMSDENVMKYSRLSQKDIDYVKSGMVMQSK